MNAYQVVPGRRGEDHRQLNGLGALAQAHTSPITTSEVESELRSRGYAIEAHPPPPPKTTLSRSGAIKIAVDEALDRTGTPHTRGHLYRAPRSGYPIPENTWLSIVTWVRVVAAGYLNRQYSVPSWATSMIHSGAIHGIAGLGHVSGWIQDNPWVLQSIGDAITNYGEFLTAKNVQDAIKAVEKQTASNLKTSDIPALLQALQAQGYIGAEQSGTVASGAQQAAAGSTFGIPTNMLLLGGVVLGIILLTRK